MNKNYTANMQATEAFRNNMAFCIGTGRMGLALQEEYQQMSANKGRKVTVLDPKGEFEGTARGITANGELIVDTSEGQRLVSSGEVSVRGIYGYV